MGLAAVSAAERHGRRDAPKLQKADTASSIRQHKHARRELAPAKRARVYDSGRPHRQAKHDLARRWKASSRRVSVFDAGRPQSRRSALYTLGVPYVMNGRKYTPRAEPNYRVEGKASWYGGSFHGKRTANGETFNMNALSAAHPTLPLPSYLRVTNLENDRSLVVRLNDRGPFEGHRLIDVSVRAAKMLGFYDQGIARVRVEYLGRAEPATADAEKFVSKSRHANTSPVKVATRATR